jgi:hypothetical protein
MRVVNKRRVGGAMLAGSLAAVPMVSLGAEQASATSSPFWGVQFNACSWKCTPTSAGGGGQNPKSTNTNFGVNPANEMWSKIQGRGLPRFVSVNELCTKGFNQINALLAPQGYTGYMWTSKSGLTSSSGGCPSFGNGLWVRNASAGAFLYSLGVQESGSSEVRGGVCAPSGGDGGTVWVCTAHLATAVAPAQASQLRSAMDTWFNNQGKAANIVAGDFNQQPDEAGAKAFSGNGYTDMLNGAGGTFEPNNAHIDYIWAHNGAVTGPDAIGGASTYRDASSSDHYQLWGGMHIK